MVMTYSQQTGLVLIVDNSPIARKQIQEALGNNWEIITAENGAEALDKFSKFRPSIVTLGVKMPVMDGQETLKRILHMDSSVSVVMVTSVENDETIRKCFDSGALGYVIKPFTPEELNNTITIAKKTDVKHRKIIFILTRMMSEIEDIFGNVGYIKPLVSLKDINVHHPDQPTNINHSEIHKIRNVELRSLEYTKPPKEYKGFAADIKTQNGIAGRIITWIELDSLARFREHYVKKVDMPYEQTLESINIFHDKIAAELSDATDTPFETGDIKPFDIAGKDYDRYLHEMHTKLDGVFAKYEVSYKDVIIPVEVHLYFNAHALFASKF